MLKYLTQVGLCIVDDLEVFGGFCLRHPCPHGVVFVGVVNSSKCTICYFYLSFCSPKTKTDRFKGVF